MSGSSETFDMDISHLRTNHIGSVDRMDRYLITNDVEGKDSLHATADDTQLHLGALRSTQTTHNLVSRHLHTSNGSVVYQHDTVTCQYSHLLRRSVDYRLNDEECIIDHIKLYTDTVKVTLQRFVHCLYLLRVSVGRVRIQLVKHSVDSILHEFVLIHAVHIEGVNRHFSHLKLAEGTVCPKVDCHLCACRQRSRQSNRSDYRMFHYYYLFCFICIFFRNVLLY